MRINYILISAMMFVYSMSVVSMENTQLVSKKKIELPEICKKKTYAGFFKKFVKNEYEEVIVCVDYDIDYDEKIYKIYSWDGLGRKYNSKHGKRELLELVVTDIYEDARSCGLEAVEVNIYPGLAKKEQSFFEDCGFLVEKGGLDTKIVCLRKYVPNKFRSRRDSKE